MLQQIGLLHHVGDTPVQVGEDVVGRLAQLVLAVVDVVGFQHLQDAEQRLALSVAPNCVAQLQFDVVDFDLLSARTLCSREKLGVLKNG